MLTSGRFAHVLTGIFASAGAILLVEHPSSAACITAGLLILSAAALRLGWRANHAQSVANQRTGAAAATLLAARDESCLPTNFHDNPLHSSELIIVQHAPRLMMRRRQLTLTAAHGFDDTLWLQEVERFIDEVIEESGCHVRASPENLRAVRWMIAGATARFGLPGSIDMAGEFLQNAA